MQTESLLLTFGAGEYFARGFSHRSACCTGSFSRPSFDASVWGMVAMMSMRVRACVCVCVCVCVSWCEWVLLAIVQLFQTESLLLTFGAGEYFARGFSHRSAC